MGRIRDFLAELKQRHVYRVAAVYGVVAWIIVQAASILVPELMLPAWITRGIIVVALLGFPIALVLAWAYDITPHGVQRTDTSNDAARAEAVAAQPAGRGRRPVTTRVVLVVGAVLLAAGVIGVYALRAPTGRPLPRGAALLTTLDSLSDHGSYSDAFELARRAAEEGAVVPDSISTAFTDYLTVLSEPAGALVRGLRFAPGTSVGDHAAWIELGSTPLRGLAIPRGDYLLRIAADGHAVAERIASAAGIRSVSRARDAAEVLIDVQLQPAARVPDGMVHVPGGLYRVASRDLQSLSATLDEFFIDRAEVTNAAFAEFVDAGGYTRQEYWHDLMDEAGAAARTLLDRFVDRTGLHAPREWSGQQPAADAAAHPVTGVSWYEAAAYCRFRNARLPTLFEWEKAARNGIAAVGQGIEMPWGYVGARDPATERANFSGTGTAPVGSYPFGLSAYGALDMAGNVKEWLHNRSESGRAVTGGSWADPIYVFSEVGAIDPASASPTIGFRCARSAETERDGGERSRDIPIRLAVETPSYRPVDDATFRMLLAHYDYDPRALDAVVEQRSETPAWTFERITYNGPADERVTAYLFLPRTGRPPFPTMVYVPSSAAFYGNKVSNLAEEELGPLVRAGRALFTVAMKGMTERPHPPGFEMPRTNSVAFRDLMVLHATELRLGLDYLETRDDIDASKLAYVGTSWGAGSRLLFAAVDDRFRATVLIGAGIDERVHPTLPEASNINFAPHIRGPKLIVNGREDEEHPWLTRALPLWNLLSEPKELKLFDGVGHWPPAELRIPAIRDFLDRHLPP